MSNVEIIINSNIFSNIEEFYIEIDNLLTKDLTWKTGHNLDAFNDLLRGGFGVYEYYESITIIWENSEKSKKDLGYIETIKYYESVLLRCHPTNIDNVKALIKDLKEENGETLFDIIIHIIKSHDHIELILK